MVIGIVVGLLIWLVVPMFFENGKRRRKNKKQRIIGAVCKIVGIVIIVTSIVRHFLDV